MTAIVCAGSSVDRVAEECAQRLREQGMEVVQCALGEVAAALDGLDGALDVLVTVSDTLAEGSIEGTSDEAFRDLLEANLTAVFRASRAAFGAMRTHGAGSMIHVCGDAGIRAAHETATYSVACAGVIALSEVFAAEGAPHGIRANAVCARPGTDVASIVAWLASDESAHVNGATIRVDDGAGAAMVLDTRV